MNTFNFREDYQFTKYTYSTPHNQTSNYGDSLLNTLNYAITVTAYQIHSPPPHTIKPYHAPHRQKSGLPLAGGRSLVGLDAHQERLVLALGLHKEFALADA